MCAEDQTAKLDAPDDDPTLIDPIDPNLEDRSREVTDKYGKRHIGAMRVGLRTPS
jgi:hypothetical protein